MKVLITGGSGLLGSSLTKKLVSEKIEVVHLTREKSSKNDVKNYIWDWRNTVSYTHLRAHETFANLV